MALTKITKADLDAAIKKLTTSDATVWWKVLATTDEGTDLCFVVGWEYYDDEDDRFYQDKGYTICAKIGYKPHNLMVMDYDDIYMPFDKKTGDVWDTDSAVDKDPSYWDMLVRTYNSAASAIWRKYGKPNRDGMSALDLMESKKKEAKKHTCSMQKKKESLAKKNEGASDTIKVTAENVMLTVNDVYVDDHGGSFSVETPEEGKSYNLLDMQEMIRGMCEDCTGYANYSRDGSELLIEVMAGEMDDNGEWTGDYYKAYSFRCTARIMSYSLEGIIDFLDESN